MSILNAYCFMKHLKRYFYFSDATVYQPTESNNFRNTLNFQINNGRMSGFPVKMSIIATVIMFYIFAHNIETILTYTHKLCFEQNKRSVSQFVF